MVNNSTAILKRRIQISTAVQQNLARFPEEFRFQLTNQEYENLRSQFVTSGSGCGRQRTPSVRFPRTTGLTILSAVLRSDVGISVSAQIMNAFVQIGRLIAPHIIQQL